MDVMKVVVVTAGVCNHVPSGFVTWNHVNAVCIKVLRRNGHTLRILRE